MPGGHMHTTQRRKKVQLTGSEPHYDEIDAWQMAFTSPTDFLRYFSKKIKNFEKQRKKYQEILDEYKEQLERSDDFEQKLRTRDEQAYKIQQSLAQLQGCIYEERENYVKLVSENEQLKLENEDYRRKFQILLILSGKTERDVTYYLQKNPEAIETTDKMVKIREEIRVCTATVKNKYDLLNPAILTKQVAVLEKELEDLRTLKKDKADFLEKELKVVKEESEIRIQHLEERLHDVSSRLTESHDLLHQALVANLELQKSMMLDEKEWTEERVAFIGMINESNRERRKCGENHFPSTELEPTSKCEDHSTAVKKLQRDISRTENQLLDKENLLEEYKMQSLRIEKQLHRTQDESQAFKKTFEEQTKKLIERNKVLQKRCEDIERRRKLDGAGFREDIKNLRQFLNVLEKKIHESTLKKMKAKVAQDVIEATVTTIASIASARGPSKPTKQRSMIIPQQPVTVPHVPCKSMEVFRHGQGGIGEGKLRRVPNILFSPETAREAKQYTDSARMSQEALTRLMDVASDKVKILEQLLRR